MTTVASRMKIIELCMAGPRDCPRQVPVFCDRPTSRHVRMSAKPEKRERAKKHRPEERPITIQNTKAIGSSIQSNHAKSHRVQHGEETSTKNKISYAVIFVHHASRQTPLSFPTHPR